MRKIPRSTPIALLLPTLGALGCGSIAAKEEPPIGQNAQGLTWTFPGKARTLQETIDTAKPGDTIEISGVVSERAIVNKSCTLLGKAGAVLLGGIQIMEPATVVNVVSLTLRGNGITSGRRSSKLLLNVNASRIEQASGHGIYALRAHVRLSESEIVGSKQVGLVVDGDGDDGAAICFGSSSANGSKLHGNAGGGLALRHGTISTMFCQIYDNGNFGVHANMHTSGTLDQTFIDNTYGIKGHGVMGAGSATLQITTSKIHHSSISGISVWRGPGGEEPHITIGDVELHWNPLALAQYWPAGPPELGAIGPFDNLGNVTCTNAAGEPILCQALNQTGGSGDPAPFPSPSP